MNPGQFNQKPNNPDGIGKKIDFKLYLFGIGNDFGYHQFERNEPIAEAKNKYVKFLLFMKFSLIFPKNMLSLKKKFLNVKILEKFKIL